MMNIIRNMFGRRMTHSRGRYGVLGNVARRGMSSRMFGRSRRGGMGRIFRSARSGRRGGLGAIGTLLGLGALVAGSIFGVRQLSSSSRHTHDY